jgi:hypothetical protein
VEYMYTRGYCWQKMVTLKNDKIITLITAHIH